MIDGQKAESAEGFCYEEMTPPSHTHSNNLSEVKHKHVSSTSNAESGSLCARNKGLKAKDWEGV